MRFFLQVIVLLTIGSWSVVSPAANQLSFAKQLTTMPGAACLADGQRTSTESLPPQARSQEDGQAGLPKHLQAMLDGLRERVARQAELAELMSRADSFYRQGEQLYKSGDRDGAEAKFELARQSLLSAQEENFYEPSVHSYFLQLGRQVAALKGVTALPSASGELIGGSERVQAFLNYYQGKGQSVVRTALARLGQYEAMMRKIFQEEGVPEEFIYVGLVESAYNPYAHSPTGAKGIWQFVRETGERYGLKRVGDVDERQDPEKATRAAAQYLRDLYEMFSDWKLALAAYNAGEYRVLKVIEKTGVRDFWQMSERRLLPQETINYVPTVLAAMALGKREFVPKPAQVVPGVKRVGKRY